MTDATELRFTQGDATWLALRERFCTDLYWACAAVLGYGSRIPMTEHAHRLLCRFAECKTGEPALDQAHVRKLELPREWGKTTLITQGRSIQRICANPDTSICLMNEKEQNARDILAAIKWQFESNDVLRALFPEVIPTDFSDTTWSASRIVVNRTSGRKEPTVFVIGVGGTVTGMHPDHVLVDDMISREAMENARAGSWQIMHQVNRWINQLHPLPSKECEDWSITFIGTRWWHGDSYEHIDIAYGYGETPVQYNLRCRLPNGETQILPAYRTGDLAIFRRAAIENGRSAFPEKWSLDDLARMRVRDEALFAANMMNSPSDNVTATFKEEWLHYFDWVSERQVSFAGTDGRRRVLRLDDLDIIFIVDPGGFAARAVEDRARPAVVCLADAGEGVYLLLDIYSEKDTFLACIQQLCAWVTRYHPRKVAIERVGQQAAFIELVRQAFRERGFTVSLDEVKPGKTQKEMRILGLEPYFQRGQLYIGKGAAFHEFRQQYSQFPRSARFDVLDALAYFPQLVRRGGGSASRGESVTERRDRELAAYRARREQR